MKGRKVLIVLGAVCVLPLLASYALYYFWRPDSTVNYGTLLSPVALPVELLTKADGRSFEFSSLKGRWVLVYASGSNCDAECEQALYYIRQVRKAQGEHQERIERVWLLTDGAAPNPDLLKAVEGMHVVRAGSRATTLAAFSAGDLGRRAIHLVDPLGQVMMRYPEQPDPKKMIKDFQRLMKYSRLG